MEIFSDWGDINGGLHFLARYSHILFGITWIGLLYFFNFVQVPAYAEMDPGARSEALRKVTFRALWWFRFAALFTFGTGVVMLGIGGSDYKFNSAPGLSIYIGSLLGTTMAANVWMVIWPNQQINIGSAEKVAAGGEADPRAAGAAKQAARASRVNAFFSIPMVFFMVFTSHYAPRFGEINGNAIEIGGGKLAISWIIVLAIWAFAELSALGKLPGGLDSPFCKLVFDDHRKTIYAGLATWVVLYVVCFELIIGTP